MSTYKLSIHAIDGETVYQMIGTSKPHLLEFLRRYDHEGSDIFLCKRDGNEGVDIDNPDDIYKELGYQV